ncbi:hypothetical protein MTR62_02235 [Novosphingobium sp. 1949]|uniref:Uncharacterized protein n=1 Tax=Novosphingobium organovorum TaxID=2930092 RepID=A0ABT0B911_9SPHN|nr:hypothetical protein [Novosphingobium organovorum]MCJ2181532.1 hypothetical protein [Novosphingobium organovorum]
MRDRFTRLSLDTFADQFEPVEHGYLYRRSLKGAPIPVSADERDAFVAVYQQRQKRLPILAAGFGLALIGAAMLLFGASGKGMDDSAIWAICVVILIVIFAATHWNWTRPVRRLAGRAAVGEACSKAIVRRRNLARITYPQVFGAPVLVGLMLWKISGSTDLLHGWGRLWLVLGGLAVAGALVQGLRKWWIERAP